MLETKSVGIWDEASNGARWKLWKYCTVSFCESGSIKRFIQGMDNSISWLNRVTFWIHSHVSRNIKLHVNFQDNVLHLITKTMVKNARLVDFLESHFAFGKEASFYSHIIPAIDLFERDAKIPVNEKIDIFIRCFGSRLSLDPSKFQLFDWYFSRVEKIRIKFDEISDAKEADDDAIVMLENIKTLNYVNVDRFIGLNTDETLAVVKVLQIYFNSNIFTFNSDFGELF